MFLRCGGLFILVLSNVSAASTVAVFPSVLASKATPQVKALKEMVDSVLAEELAELGYGVLAPAGIDGQLGKPALSAVSSCSSASCIQNLRRRVSVSMLVLPTLIKRKKNYLLRFRVYSNKQIAPDIDQVLGLGRGAAGLAELIRQRHTSWFVDEQALDMVPLPEAASASDFGSGELSVPLPDAVELPDPAPINTTPKPRKRTLLYSGIATSSAGIIAGLIGVGFGSFAQEQARRLPTPGGSTAGINAVVAAEVLERNKELVSSANISFAISGVLVASGLALIVVDQTVFKKKHQIQSSVALGLAPSGVSLSLSARF